MDLLIWVGAAISLIGLMGIVACIASVARARRNGLEDDAMRARLQRVVLWNLASLFVSALGLALVIVGIILG